jgi:hypothetical protein
MKRPDLTSKKLSFLLTEHLGEDLRLADLELKVFDVATVPIAGGFQRYNVCTF